MMILYSFQTVLLSACSFSIGATVYFDIEKFDECILDCDKAIELNKGFAKVSTCQTTYVCRHTIVKHRL